MKTIDICAINWANWPVGRWNAGHWQHCEANRHLEAVHAMHPMSDSEASLRKDWPQWEHLCSGQYAFRSVEGRVAIATFGCDCDGETICERLEVTRGN